ncbi:hypothetical protein D3C85_951930 [compost metagenome]
MSEIESFALLTCATILLIGVLIVTFILYQDRKHWRERAIEAEVTQALMKEEILYLRSRPIKPDLHVIRGTNEKP